MIPIIWVNCSRHPFLKQIADRSKVYETRTRNMLGRFLGERVLFCETGTGMNLVRCSAVISEIVEVRSQWEWIQHYRKPSCIVPFSEYDWQPGTKVKWLYKLTDVRPVLVPFTPPEERRHGRVWMEFHPDKIGIDLSENLWYRTNVGIYLLRRGGEAHDRP